MTISNNSPQYDLLQAKDQVVVNLIDDNVREQFAEWEAQTLAEGGTPHKPNEETLAMPGKP